MNGLSGSIGGSCCFRVNEVLNQDILVSVFPRQVRCKNKMTVAKSVIRNSKLNEVKNLHLILRKMLHADDDV